MLQSLLIIVLIGTAIANSLGFNESLDYVVHFTNWSWTLQIIFYTLTLTAVAQTCVPFASCVIAVVLLPLTAIVMSVFVLVWILLGVGDAQFISELFKVIRPGIVMIGNDWFHLSTVGFLLLYYLAWGPLIYYSLYRAFTHPYIVENERCRFALVVYQIWGFLLVAAAYFAVLTALGTSVNEVYGTQLNVGAGIAVAATVALVVNGTILLVLARCYGVCRRRSVAQEALLRHRVTSTAFEDLLELETEADKQQR